MILLLISFVTEQKEKLTEVEQQLKKAEAAQRRRIQNEKAAREEEVCSISFNFVPHECLCSLLKELVCGLFKCIGGGN